MDIITSRSNPLVIETAKLKEKKYRDRNRSFIFEGIKLAKEAVYSNVALRHIFMTEECAKKNPDLAKRKNVILISEPVCQKLTDDSSPEGIICVAEYDEKLHTRYENASENDLADVCLILSSVRDPGNFGTIVRTSAAFGKRALLVSDDCADVYNMKTVKASMGAIFRTPIFRTSDLCRAIKEIRARGRSVYAAALTDTAIPLQKIKNAGDSCFAVGNEGHGLDEKTIECCDAPVIIPMEEGSESLNAAMASAVILWETYRQKVL